MKIRFLCESVRGHDTKLIDESEAQKETEDVLKKDYWATVEKKDGSTEILTKADLPEEKGKKEEDWKQTFGTPKMKPIFDEKEKPKAVSKDDKKKWEDNFKEVESITATNKAKGG